ncbi:MAG TPA: PAS domain S-box protein [Planctomycetota bacterium]|nr:PAS domain S-box protein [Planctomycetota bacterium]
MASVSPQSDVQILLLEDVPADADLLKEALEKSGIHTAIRQVDRREEFVKALEDQRPDIILADHALPAFRNDEALALARDRYPDVPFIFVSGAVGEERAVEAIKEGATDYVLKDHLVRLGPAVLRALEECRERRERVRSDQALRLILENALDAVAAMDQQGIVTAWNPQAESVFGWTTAEAVGRPLADLIIPERLRAAHWAGLARYLAHGTGPILGRRVEMLALHRDGHEFPVELTVTPIVQGKDVWFSAFIRDISVPRRLTERLSMEHSVAKILAEASGADAAVSQILEALGRGLDWDLAVFWRRDPAREALMFADGWSAAPAFAELVQLRRDQVYPRGEGLPGRVWAEGAVEVDGAFAFPVREGADLLGVIEGHAGRRAPLDPDLFDVLEVIGSQIGQFLRRKKSEESIRTTEKQLRIITDALPSLIAYVDRNRRYGFVNRAYVEWFGIDPRVILGRTLAEVLGDKAYDTIRTYVDRALSGERVQYEARVAYRKGERWIEANYVPDVAPGGTVSGFFALVTDITARKESEESIAFLSDATKILASSLDYETTLANIARLAVPRIADWSAVCFLSGGVVQPLAVIHKDPAKAATVADFVRRCPCTPTTPNSCCQVLDSGRPSLISIVTEKHLRTLARNEEHLGILRTLGLHSIMTVPIIVSGRTVAALTLASTDSGREYGEDDLRFAEELARRAALAMENARLYREVRHESDERKRALEAVRDLNEHLERRVLERTAKLEGITRELDAFASTVAHDLRAPLRIMKGFSEMLIEDYSGKTLDVAGQEYAKKIDRASMRMSVLVEDLLAYSRLSREEVPITAVDLEDAVNEVLMDMAEELRAARAEVAVRKPLGRVLGHGVLLLRVLANLIGNAVKFVAPGTLSRVTLRAEEDGEDWIRLWIEDNGIGIESEYLERIFGVFERLHSQEVYPGTGLGLAIVRRAVERMGGSVGAESTPDRGSRFWIRLRRAPAPAASGM